MTYLPHISRYSLASFGDFHTSDRKNHCLHEQRFSSSQAIHKHCLVLKKSPTWPPTDEILPWSTEKVSMAHFANSTFIFLKCPSQICSSNTCSLVGHSVLGDCGTLKRWGLNGRTWTFRWGFACYTGPRSCPTLSVSRSTIYTLHHIFLLPWTKPSCPTSQAIMDWKPWALGIKINLYSFPLFLHHKVIQLLFILA